MCDTKTFFSNSYISYITYSLDITYIIDIKYIMYGGYIMKKRVSIYIDSELWDNVKERAWRGRVSASEYISGLLRDDISPNGKPLVEVFKESEPVEEFNLAEAQKKLDAEKASRNIKEEKIKLVRERVKESGFFNPQPKSMYGKKRG